MATRLEEIVVSTDRLAAKQIRPNFGNCFFDRPPRWYETGTRRGPRSPGVGEGLAVDLPVGCERESVQEDER